MKNKLSILVLVTFLFAFASCKKDYTCTCVESGANPDVEAYYFPNSSKKDARNACDLILTTSQGDYTSCDL
jgi:hypothetical protein